MLQQTNLVQHADQVRTMSSVEIAELTGKTHRNVLRDIRQMVKSLHGSNLSSHHEEGFYLNKRGQKQPLIRLDKNTTLTLLSGYDVVARHKIVTRWSELEAEKLTPLVATQPVEPPIPDRIFPLVFNSTHKGGRVVRFRLRGARIYLCAEDLQQSVTYTYPLPFERWLTRDALAYPLMDAIGAQGIAPQLNEYQHTALPETWLFETLAIRYADAFSPHLSGWITQQCHSYKMVADSIAPLAPSQSLLGNVPPDARTRIDQLTEELMALRKQIGY